MNTRIGHLHLIDWILAIALVVSACTPTLATPAPQILPAATAEIVVPTATLALPASTVGIPGGHTTTIWQVEANRAYDALCFIPTLTGDPFYLKFYQSEYNRFAPKLTPTVKQALEEIRTVVKEHDSLLSSKLVSLFLPLAPKTLGDLVEALDNPDTIRLGAQLAEDDEAWLLISSHIPNLKIVIRWMQGAGFEKDYEENIYPGILKRTEQLNKQLPEYNIIPIIEAALGEPLPSNQFKMYLANYPLPFGIGLGANVSLFYSGLLLSGIVNNSIHENLHILDIQEKELWEALSFLKNDDYYMNNFKTHDPNGGYMVYEEFLEEDVIEALDQLLAERLDVAENPRTRWGSQPAGTHTLSPVLYTLLKQESYSPEKETYHDFLIRMVREGKLKAGMIEQANHQFYANKTGSSISTATPPANQVVNVVSRENNLGNRGMESSSPQGPQDPAEVESFLGDLFTKQMQDYGIAGLTFSLVKDGQVFFQKGYGYADLENKTPVDSTETIFRTGSITKLFTWTAVMQLAEQGKVNLDGDINTYLDFKIPDTFPQPITLKHLLSHTAGFEDLAYGTRVRSYDQVQPLGQWLESHLPARVRPVGQLAVYSNYGADLAGYIVERVSGMPYAEYLEANIFQPLGMDHSTARLPIPAEVSPSLSTGYQVSGQPASFLIPGTGPDCCVSSTAADMASFMLAHLNGGQLPSGKGKILEAATAQQMQTSLWAPDPRVKGFAYGFMEVTLNGQRILYHSGDITPFHGLLVLIPDQKLGFFVTYNTETAGNLWASDLLSFIEHYFPQDKVAPQPPEGFDAQADRFTGYYRPMRGAYTTLEKVNVLKSWAVVQSSNDGTLLWQTAFSPVSIPIVEIAPLLFAEPQSGLTSVFMEDAHQNTTYVYDELPTGLPYEKLPWHANPYLHTGLLAICSVLLLSAILAVPGGFVLRLIKKDQPHTTQPLSRVSRFLAFLVAALDLVGLGLFLFIFLGSGEAILYGQNAILNIMLGTWLVAAILTVPLLVLAVLSWKKHSWGVAIRVHYSLVVVACLAFTWFLSYWNMLGFRY